MHKTQEQLKQRIEKSQEIYERFYQEYHNLPQEKRYNYGLDKRVCAEIQLKLVVSERKAKEYLKLVKIIHKSLTIQQIT